MDNVGNNDGNNDGKNKNLEHEEYWDEILILKEED